MATQLRVKIDETAGVQTGTTANDFGLFGSISTPLPLNAALTDLALSPTGVVAALSGVSASTPSGDPVPLNTANLQDMGFRASVYAGGLDSGLTTTSGLKIFLFSYANDNNVLIGRVGTAGGAADSAGQIAFLLYLDSLGTGSDTTSDAGATSVQLWMLQFVPLSHPDANNPNDEVSIDPSKLVVDMNSLLEFDATNAPSGQNVFLMIGDGTPSAGEIGLVATSTDPLDANGGGVHTSQGGDGMTLGVGNQQIVAGKGLYISFVKLSQTGADNYTVPNLSATEADNSGNIQFDSYYGTDPTAEIKSASFDMSQMQPNNGGATLQVAAINNQNNQGATETGAAYISGLGDADDSIVSITKITITRTAVSGSQTEVKSHEFTAGESYFFGFAILDDDDPWENVTVVFEAGGTVKIIGARDGDHIVYETVSGHNRVRILNVGDPNNADLNARFDVGNFNLESGGLTQLPIDNVSFVDDAPSASQGQATGTVDEDGLPGGIAGGVGDVAGEALTANGSVTTLFNGGADGAASYSLSTVTSGLPTLTSGGTTVVYAVANNTLTATAGQGGATVFTFALNGTTGAYLFTLARPLDHASGNDENDITIDLSSILRVTDGDGDTASAAANALVITVDDDTPRITAASNLVYPNSANPPPGTDAGGTGIFAYDIGADKHFAPYSATNSDFSSVSLASGTVGPNAITNRTITWASETDSQAVFNFSFTYVSNNPNQGDTTNATGTLTFDKVNDTYAVRLSNEIESFSIVRTSTAQGFTGYNIDTTPPIDETPINQQPPVSVARLVSDFQVQFSGVQSVGGNTPVAITAGGDGAFAAGEVLTASNTWVSVSGTAVGVAGDTMQNGEVLDMDFFTANPFGNTAAQPDATARGIFLKFDGIGNEDLVIILKLVDATNSALTTTRAIIVDSEDIIIKTPSTRANNFHPIANPASYGVTLDQNDGLVIIENNDFNFGTENYVIQGAQVMTSTEGLTGSGYGLNGNVGATGATNGTTTWVFGNEYNEGSSSNPNEAGEAGTWDGDVVKISDMGFLASTTPDATLVFNVGITDNDGDSTATQTLNVRIEGDNVFSGGNDTDTDAVLAAVTTVVSGFNPATGSLDFTSVGTATNYSESLVNAGTLAAYIAAADAALNGTVDYYFGVVNGNGYLAVDADGTGITAIVQLTGVTDLAFTNIV